MRAARILAEDPNPTAAENLREKLLASAAPVTPIQSVSDLSRLQKLSITNAKFQEQKRVYDLSRKARLLKEEPGRLKVRVLRPRTQMIGEDKRSTEAFADFFVEVDSTCRGLVLKQTITRKQEFLGLPTIPLPFLRLFLHELAGRSFSPFIGREIIDGRKLDEYGITVGQNYDVTAWQNQSVVGTRTGAVVLLVDARPGRMLPEQAMYLDDCRAKETPCYTRVQ